MKTYFHEELLINVKCKLWVAKTKDKTVLDALYVNLIFLYAIWVAVH